MALNNINPSGTDAWHKLREHFYEMQYTTMQEMFAADAKRAEKFHLEWNDFFIDYSKNIINDTTLKLLTNLALECKLPDAIQQYFNGSLINGTEKRAVLHTALRANENDVIKVNGINIIPEITSVKRKIKAFSEDIINGNKKGHTGKNFTDIVNIGIGGSDLGPDMAVEALSFYRNHLKLHFISNVDGDAIAETLKRLDPETTLFIIVSKTFTTQETLTNAQTIKQWFLNSGKAEDISKHFVAVSSNIEKTLEFGITQENIFPMWDWVGGRFSLWGAVGLSIALSVGYDNYEKLLYGAREMDEHFKTAPIQQNIPVTLALLGIWYTNFFGAETEAIIPYTEYLKKLPAYLQQSFMESNGKSVGRDGNPVNYHTSPIIWGATGTNAQHAFFQLIHQGTRLIPSDFIGFIKPLHENKDHHNKLMANFFAQTEALLKGKTYTEFDRETTDSILIPFKTFRGNKPTNSILIDRLTPEALGSLIAMYEHKIFTQGVIWNIFSYDQWGVELGKQLANAILNEIDTGKTILHDNSTSLLIRRFLNNG